MSTTTDRDPAVTQKLSPEELGFTRLPAKRRKVRVSLGWMAHLAALPAVVVEDGVSTDYASVEILGPARLISGEDRKGVRWAYFDTKAELLVK